MSKYNDLFIRLYGDKVLREKSKEIADINDDIIDLANQMIALMKKNNNTVGLAANQVGVPLKLFIIRNVILEDDGKNYKLGEPEVFINPVLTDPSIDTEMSSEGCLSFPQIYLDIERPQSIHIKALNLKGECIEETAHGFRAVELMHENDHINGVLFIDRAAYKNKQEQNVVKNLLKKLKIIVKNNYKDSK